MMAPAPPSAQRGAQGIRRAQAANTAAAVRRFQDFDI